MIFDIEIDAKLWYEDEPVASTSRDDTLIVFSDKAKLEINKGKFTLAALKAGFFRLELCLISPFKGQADVMIPSVWYEGNLKGEGLFPSEKKAKYWHFEETRMAVPAMAVATYKEGSLAASLSPAKAQETLADVSWSDEGITFRIPAKEEPYSYMGKAAIVETSNLPSLSFHLKKGETLSRRINILITNKGKYETYVRFIKRFYPPTHIKPSYSWKDYREAKLTRLLNMVRKAANGGAYLIMGEGNGEVEDVYAFTSGSFLVKSLEAAVRFAQTPKEAFKSENRALQKAVKNTCALFNTSTDNLGRVLSKAIADYFLKGEIKPGLFQDCINLKTGELGGYLGLGEHPEFKYLINARCNGEAMSAYLALYDLLGDKTYLELCLRVASFYLKAQLKSGSYGRWFSLDGAPVDSNGTNGAHIGVFMVSLASHGVSELEESIEKAAEYYAYLADSEQFYADTLDADSADKEAGIAILSFLLSYMEYKHNLKYIKQAEKAAAFITTWIWQDESFIPPDTPLTKAGFSTMGLSAVSVAHHHLDFYGMLIAKDFLRLHKLTGDRFFYEQATMLLSGSLQLIKDEAHPLNRSEEYYGYQPEQINHTAWDYFSRKENARGSYEIDIAWVNVLGYGAYIDISKEFKEALDEAQRDIT